VPQLKVFISKFLSKYALTPSPIPSGEITTLAHEIGNHTMKARPLKVQRPATSPRSLLPGAKAAKILGRARDDVGAQSHFNSTCWAAADTDVEKYNLPAEKWVGVSALKAVQAVHPSSSTIADTFIHLRSC